MSTGKSKIAVSKRIANKLFYLYKRTFRNRRTTIYHCCIQKTASQWFSQFFNDPMIWKYTRLAHFNPRINFLTDDPVTLNRLNDLPQGYLVGPLYLRYRDFRNFTSGIVKKAFYVSRDPRDLIISSYFSYKFSHSLGETRVQEMRDKFNAMSESDGISLLINSSAEFYSRVQSEWILNQGKKEPRVFRFEDLFGDKQNTTFQELIEHCNLQLPAPALNELLEKLSFENISGRSVGVEDKQSHNRKGISGDWKNFFSETHKSLFKEKAGKLLIACGYESNENW
jgi:hypothetical protein